MTRELKIEVNPIELRIASAEESVEAATIRQQQPLAKYVLVSDVAFPGQRSYYRGCVEGDTIVSGGWIGSL